MCQTFAEEIDNFYNITTFDARIKVTSYLLPLPISDLIHSNIHLQCFLRCAGENGGFVIE
jgi:hypothetical protein